MEDTARRKAAAQEQALCTASARAFRSAEETIQLGIQATLKELQRRKSNYPDELATISSDEQRDILIDEDVLHEGSTAASGINRRLLKEGHMEEVALFTSQSGNSAEYRKVYASVSNDQTPSSDALTLKSFMEDMIPILKKYRHAPGVIFRGLKALIYCEGVRNLLPPWLNLLLGRTTVDHLVYKK